MHTITCPVCGKKVSTSHPRKRYCSSLCGERYHNQDKKARRAANRLKIPSYAEMRFLPIEQTLEYLTARELGQALGWNKDTAQSWKRDPSKYVGTELEYDVLVQRIHTWLESQA